MWQQPGLGGAASGRQRPGLAAISNRETAPQAAGYQRPLVTQVNLVCPRISALYTDSSDYTFQYLASTHPHTRHVGHGPFN